MISGDASPEAFAAMRPTTAEVLFKPVLPGELRMLAERMLAAANRDSRIEGSVAA
jgi:hypothetical protein